MAKNDKQVHFRAPAEFVDALNEAAAKGDMNQAAYIREAVQEKMSGMYQSGTHSEQAESPELTEQLNRIEYNMGVLHQAMTIMAEQNNAMLAGMGMMMSRMDGLERDVHEARTLPAYQPHMLPPAEPEPQRTDCEGAALSMLDKVRQDVRKAMELPMHLSRGRGAGRGTPRNGRRGWTGSVQSAILITVA